MPIVHQEPSLWLIIGFGALVFVLGLGVIFHDQLMRVFPWWRD